MKNILKKAWKYLAASAVVVLLVALCGVTASAASYEYTVYQGANFYVDPGDYLFLSHPNASSEFAFWDYYWSIHSGGDVISIDPGSDRVGIIQAKKGGTAVLYAELTGSAPQTNYGSRYNSVTKRWEQYTYTTYRSYTYKYSFIITVTDNEPPAITAQPVGTGVSSGKTASVSVNVSDASPVSYQWYVKDPGESTYRKSSVTSATYTCRMSKNVSGRSVYCVITDDKGYSTQSKAVVLSMLQLGSIPTLKTAKNGTKASVTADAQGSSLTYQWYVKEKNASTFQKSSATGKTYSFTMSSDKSGRQVYCVVTDKYGNSVKTKTVTMRVPYNATIKTQPTNATVASGKTASVTVKATGDGLTYQWYVKNVGSSKFTKSSVTGKTYSMKMTEAKSGRKVYCVIKDSYGNTVKTKTVTLSLLVITKQPQNLAVASGAKATATVNVTGSGLKYQWYVKDVGSSKFAKSSVTQKTYTVKMNAARSGRQVYCVIRDRHGNTVKTKTVTLSMITVTKQPVSGSVKLGKVIKVPVTVKGEGLKYTWYVKNSGGEFKKSSITSNTYSCKMTEQTNGRQVYCVITDKYGNTVKTAKATLYAVGFVSRSSQLTGGIGQTVYTKLTAVGKGLTYQWYVKEPGSSKFVKSSVKSATYTFDMSKAKSGRQVYCVITDAYGNSVKGKAVTFSWLQITQQPTVQHGGWWDNMVFAADAVGEGLSYQWYYLHDTSDEWRAMYNGNTAVLRFDMTHTYDDTQFCCVVTDKYGNTCETVRVYAYYDYGG